MLCFVLVQSGVIASYGLKWGAVLVSATDDLVCWLCGLRMAVWPNVGAA